MADEEKSVLQVIVEIVDKVSEPLKGIKEDFDSFSDSVHQIWAAGAEVFAGYEAIKGLVEPAADMAEAQAHLALATQFGAEKLAEMKDQAEQLSTTVPQSIEEITGAQEELYKTFGNTTNLEEVTKLSANLATVLGVDATKGANILAGSYEQLGDKTKPLAEQLGIIGDKLALLKNRFMKPGEANNLERDIQKIGLSAQAAGISQNQMFALWAEGNKLHAGGPRGFGMQEAELFDTLAKSSKELSKAGLQVVHTSTGGVNIIQTLERINKMSQHGKMKLFAELPQQAKVLVEMADHVDDLRKSMGEFRGSNGELEKAAGVLSDTPLAKLEILKNQLSNVADTLGTQLLPPLIVVVTKISTFLTELNRFAETHPVLTQMAADFVAIVAGLLTMAGLFHFGEIIIGVIELGAKLSGLGEIWFVLQTALTEGFAEVGTAAAIAFDANPIGIILTALGLVIVALYEIWKHWDQITNAIKGATDAAITFAHNATGKDWLKEIGDVATGNFAMAGVDFAGVKGRSEVHYSPTVHVNVGPGTDPHAVAGAVGNQMSLHGDALKRMLQQVHQEGMRTSFGDPMLAGGN
jgi:TP901 family phage tail tape measure protein